MVQKASLIRCGKTIPGLTVSSRHSVESGLPRELGVQSGCRHAFKKFVFTHLPLGGRQYPARAETFRLVRQAKQKFHFTVASNAARYQ